MYLMTEPQKIHKAKNNKKGSTRQIHPQVEKSSKLLSN